MNADAIFYARSISIVGLMGVGKTTIGRRLSKRLDLPFFDSDDEIEKASGRSIKGYFKDYGEDAFRSGERRVIERLLDGRPLVLSTGGGAFIPDATRKIILENSLVIWLHADFDTIMSRVSLKNTRPLLDVPDPVEAMRKLMEVRNPIYAKAHISVSAGVGTHHQTVERVMTAITDFQKQDAQNSAGEPRGENCS
ncbi:MAG: shikimate kinase [Robiginitomaculum sp.]|nr:MAG: shikimate kinase [Robiginitomaculum sp.]